MVVETAAPKRTSEQRRQALKRANATRTVRAGLKRRLKCGGKDSLAEAVGLLLGPPPELRSMYVIDFLRCLPRWGVVRAETMLRDLDVSPRVSVGGLSLRQRGEIVRVLQDRRL